MSLSLDLPRNWKLDFQIKDLIPETHDWKSFKRFPFAPRYAVCIRGGGVFDLQRRVFLSPKIDKRTRRKRYRLVTSDIPAGKRGAPRTRFYAVMILTLVEGARPDRKTQCHHLDHDRTNDTWKNLAWTSAKANKRLATQHKSRQGAANPNAKDRLSRELPAFIAYYDNQMHEHGRVDLKDSAEHFGTSTDHLRRIAQGKVRSAEVREIRERLRREAEEVKKLNAAFANADNPFL